MWSPSIEPGKKPLYLQLVDAMANAIQTGELAIGEKLPPQRQLAWHLGVNPSTVTKAFQEATKRHLIAGEVGRGTYILGQSSEAALFELKQISENAAIDLSTHVAAQKHNDDDLKQTLASIVSCESDLSEHLQYHSSQSIQKMRIAASHWLKEFGYLIKPMNCIPCPSAQNALQATLLAFCKKDETILVDNLTFPGIKAVAKQLGLKLYGVDMDEQGITPQAIELALRTTHARVLVSDPTLQNPTGCTMGPERRQQILKIIEMNQLLFIEEYVIGALSGIPPMTAANKKTSILITSFAKTVSPGIRFGCIAGEHPIMDKLNASPHATLWQISPLMGEIASQWIESGTAQTRTQWQWSEINRRYRLFKGIFPSNQYPGNINVCSHVWLPISGSAEDAANRCRLLGVEVVPSSVFAVDRKYTQHIRVSLTAARSLQQLKIGLERIKKSNAIASNDMQ